MPRRKGRRESRLRQLRKARGLTQAQLALRADISPGHLSRIEAGARVATMSHCRAIAEALGAELGDAFTTKQLEKSRRRPEAPLALWIEQNRGTLEQFITPRDIHRAIADATRAGQ